MMTFFVGFILVIFSGLLLEVCRDFCFYCKYINHKTNEKYELEGRQEMFQLSFAVFIAGLIFIVMGLWFNC